MENLIELNDEELMKVEGGFLLLLALGFGLGYFLGKWILGDLQDL